MERAALSIGVAGGLGPAAIGRIASAVEAAGLAGLWVNDTPDGDALAGLAAAAAVTERIRLATGVLPVDRRGTAEIAAQAADLPADRTVLGIGSGAARTGQLDLVRHAIDGLRDRVGARLLVGALGPRMRRLGAEHADGVLLSWLDPSTAARQAAEARAASAGAAHVALYVRTALDPDAVPRLREETARYASYPTYAANYARLGLDPGDTVLAPGATARLAVYRGAVDEVVLRAIVPSDDTADYERFVALAAPAS